MNSGGKCVCHIYLSQCETNGFPAKNVLDASNLFKLTAHFRSLHLEKSGFVMKIKHSSTYYVCLSMNSTGFRTKIDTIV